MKKIAQRLVDRVGYSALQRVVQVQFLTFNGCLVRLSFVLGLTTPIACGDPLLSAAASTSPLLALEGYVQPFPADGLTSPEVTIVWVDPAGIKPDVAALPETMSFRIDATGRFQLQLFAPPPATAGTATFTSDGTAVQFAFGEIVLYDDLAGVGSPPIGAADALIAPDDYRGATPDSVLVYIDATNAESATLPWPLLSGGPGYHLGTVDCNTFGPPVIVDADSGTMALTLQVVPASAQLPYLRTCLQSHPLTGS